LLANLKTTKAEKGARYGILSGILCTQSSDTVAEDTISLQTPG
jgi:hypothetical protein